MKIILIGFGTVGQGFVEILRQKQATLEAQHNFRASIIGVVTGSRGTLYAPMGLDYDELLHSIEQEALDHYPDQEGLERGWDALQMIRESDADVVVEISPSNYETAQPALEYVQTALRTGKHVVLANKGPIALAGTALKELATISQRQLRFEGTVMAGTPVISTALEALAGCTIHNVRGIMNGTTNYMLTQMESGLSYQDAFDEANQLGYLETDPSLDVDGWDAAGKVLILGQSIFHQQWQLEDLDVRGIADITLADIETARANDERWKLIAEANPNGGRVQPVRLPLTNPLANVSGGTNALTFSTDLMGDVTIIGSGAGKLETGSAILSDILAIYRNGL